METFVFDSLRWVGRSSVVLFREVGVSMLEESVKTKSFRREEMNYFAVKLFSFACDYFPGIAKGFTFRACMC